MQVHFDVGIGADPGQVGEGRGNREVLLPGGFEDGPFPARAGRHGRKTARSRQLSRLALPRAQEQAR